MKRKLFNELELTLKPLIDSKVLTIEVRHKNGEWDHVKIEGTFDYKVTKNILLDCVALLRNHVNLLSSRPYFLWFLDRNLLKELEKELFIFDMVVQAFLKALSLSETSLNNKMLWSYEVQFVLSNYSLINNSAQSLYQNLNEKHIRTTILIATGALLLSVFSVIFNKC